MLLTCPDCKSFLLDWVRTMWQCSGQSSSWCDFCLHKARLYGIPPLTKSTRLPNFCLHQIPECQTVNEFAMGADFILPGFWGRRGEQPPSNFCVVESTRDDEIWQPCHCSIWYFICLPDSHGAINSGAQKFHETLCHFQWEHWRRRIIWFGKDGLEDRCTWTLMPSRAHLGKFYNTTEAFLIGLIKLCSSIHTLSNWKHISVREWVIGVHNCDQ